MQDGTPCLLSRLPAVPDAGRGRGHRSLLFIVVKTAIAVLTTMQVVGPLLKTLDK